MSQVPLDLNVSFTLWTSFIRLCSCLTISAALSMAAEAPLITTCLGEFMLATWHTSPVSVEALSAIAWQREHRLASKQALRLRRAGQPPASPCL